MQGRRHLDPVCDMQATEEFFMSTYQGVSYFFCSASCQAKFEAEPSLYV